MDEYYVVRYQRHVSVKDRKHAQTVGRFDTWIDAEEHRLVQPFADRLEVEGPRRVA